MAEVAVWRCCCHRRTEYSNHRRLERTATESANADALARVCHGVVDRPRSGDLDRTAWTVLLARKPGLLEFSDTRCGRAARWRIFDPDHAVCIYHWPAELLSAPPRRPTELDD